MAEGFGARLGEFVGVEPNSKPVFFFMDFHEESIIKFIYDKEPTYEGLEAFVKGITEGEVQPYKKS